MSSVASRRYDHSRSPLSSVVLLATLLLATPGVLRAQRRPTQPDSQKTTTRTGGSDDVSVQRESTFVQRLLAALAGGLAARESTTTRRSRQTQQPRMPDVVGMDTLTALRTLGVRAQTGKPLVRYVIVAPSQGLIPIDRIAAQIPAAGTPVSLPVSVRLTLAGVQRAPDSVTVPRLIGLLERAAADTLRARRFVEDRLTKNVTAPESIGRVTGQNPPAGTRIPVGGTVAVAIGLDARVFMPNVTGLTLADAKERIRAAGIDVARIRRATVEATSRIGLVVRQLPESGSVVSSATRIVLTRAVRAPPPPPPPRDTVVRTIAMPDVAGLDTATAGRELRRLGLVNYRFLVPPDTVAVDTVDRQTPDSGVQLLATSPIDLTMRPRPATTAGLGWRFWLTAAAFALAVVVLSMLTAQRIWPPPQITPRVRLQPTFTDILGANGSLVDVSISLSSHVEHERSVLDLTGSPLD